MKRQLIHATLALATIVMVPASSFALTSSGNGRATSNDYLTRTKITVCDTSADGRAVYTDYRRAGSDNLNRLSETAGSGNCESSTSTATINKHRSCANVGLGRPDNCNPYVYPK
jgi:hypothetical protein